MFEYLARHSDEAALFSQAMIGLSNAEPPAVAEAYDSSTFDLIVDTPRCWKVWIPREPGGAHRVLCEHPRSRSAVMTRRLTCRR
jgi:hypothetical protein